MEKYSQFRDKATGIAPFWPITQSASFLLSTNDNASPVSTALNFIVKHILLVIRVAVLTPLTILSFILSSSLGLTNGLVQSLNKLVLLVLGILSTEFTVENVKTRNVTKAHYPSRTQLFFVNFSNPLDIFILSTIANDDFVCLIPSLRTPFKFKKVTVSEFIKVSISGVSSTSWEESTKHDLKEFKNKTILIFAEGTTSNGKSILKFPFTQSQFNQFFQDLTVTNDIKITKINSLGIKITPGKLTTPLEVSLIAYVYRLLTNVSGISYKVRLNVVNELNPLELDLNKIRNSFTNNGKFKLVELGHSEKAEFIKKYNR